MDPKPFLIAGFAKASPQQFLEMSSASAELTIHFPLEAIVGFEEIAQKLEAAGLQLGDRPSLLEDCLGLTILAGLDAIIRTTMEVIKDGLVGTRKNPQEETEGDGGKGGQVVQGTPKDEG